MQNICKYQIFFVSLQAERLHPFPRGGFPRFNGDNLVYLCVKFDCMCEWVARNAVAVIRELARTHIGMYVKTL